MKGNDIKMNDKNKVSYSPESIILINDVLKNIESDAMISFNVNNKNLSKDVKVDRCSFTLDDGAVELLKAYYKSKLVMAEFIKNESNSIKEEIVKNLRNI